MRRASVSILGRCRAISACAAARSPRPVRATRSASGSMIILAALLPELLPGSTGAGRFSVGEGFVHQRQKFHAIRRARDIEPVEIVTRQTDVGVQLAVAMLVEMQEGARAAIKCAARLLLEPCAPSKLREQRFEPIERGGSGVFHGGGLGGGGGGGVTNNPSPIAGGGYP